GALEALAGSRVTWTDPLMLAAVTGWLANRAVRTRPWDGTVTALSAVYAAAANASFAVQLPALVHATTAPEAAVEYDVWRALRHRHPMQGHPLAPNAPALARVIGGIGVFLLAAETARASPAVAARATRLLVLAIAGTAVLNLNRLVEIALRQPDAI